MSTRYIIRGSKNSSNDFNRPNMNRYNLINSCYNCMQKDDGKNISSMPILIRNLYKYKDLIGYNSVIYVISYKAEIRAHYTIENSNSIYLREYTKDKLYTSFEERMKKIKDMKDILCNGLVPLHFLLLDKNNNIYKINLDDEFIFVFCVYNFPKNHIIIENSNDFIIPIGEMIYYIDTFYNPDTQSAVKDNVKQEDRIENQFVDFVSKFPPAQDDFVSLSRNHRYYYTFNDHITAETNNSSNKYIYSKYTNDLINFMKNNINTIYQDLKIKEEHYEFKYVSIKKAKQDNINKKKALLKKQLKQLEEEEYDD